MPVFNDFGARLGIEEFRGIRDMIREYCGITLGRGSRFTMERRLRERLRSLDLAGFAEYCYFLKAHPERATELDLAVELLSTNETYFFRESYQLNSFQSETLPKMKQRAQERGQKQLLIWSAGCSTGEEVYSIAMIIAESGLFDGFRVRVFGSDISGRVLSVARTAEYSPASFRVCPEHFDKYFEDTPNGRKVTSEIRAMCRFGQLNLLASDRAAVVGRVDAVFCRNVLIYFDDESRRQVINTIYNRLNPGGFLMLGHSESLLNLSTAFELVHLSNDMVYQRPQTGRMGP